MRRLTRHSTLDHIWMAKNGAPTALARAVSSLGTRPFLGTARKKSTAIKGERRIRLLATLLAFRGLKWEYAAVVIYGSEGGKLGGLKSAAACEGFESRLVAKVFFVYALRFSGNSHTFLISSQKWFAEHVSEGYGYRHRTCPIRLKEGTRYVNPEVPKWLIAPFPETHVAESHIVRATKYSLMTGGSRRLKSATIGIPSTSTSSTSGFEDAP